MRWRFHEALPGIRSVDAYRYTKMLVAITTECRIFFYDSQEKNAKNVGITKFYYQQNNEQVFNIGVWSLFPHSSFRVK
jgi:hypothetical protein